MAGNSRHPGDRFIDGERKPSYPRTIRTCLHANRMVRLEKDFSRRTVLRGEQRFRLSCTALWFTAGCVLSYITIARVRGDPQRGWNFCRIREDTRLVTAYSYTRKCCGIPTSVLGIGTLPERQTYSVVNLRSVFHVGEPRAVFLV